MWVCSCREELGGWEMTGPQAALRDVLVAVPGAGEPLPAHTLARRQLCHRAVCVQGCRHPLSSLSWLVAIQDQEKKSFFGASYMPHS